MAFELSMVWYMICLGLWDIFLFVSGVMCCDLHHYLNERRSPKLDETARPESEGISNESPRTDEASWAERQASSPSS